ncbi:MAG: flagellar export chaperone FliS [Phycisphaerae bacterium]
MNRDASGEYLRNAVMTANPEQLQLMLYDGAIRFATQARESLGREDWETSCEKLIRAQRILVEMRNGLREEVNPALCRQMSALYDFIYNRLVDANMQRSQSLIDEALKVLHHQRDTWRMLIDKIREEEPSLESTPSANITSTPSSTEIGATLSIEG